MTFDIWETKHQEDYRGEFDEKDLRSFLSDFPISAQKADDFCQTVMSDKNSTKTKTLYIRNDWTIDVRQAKPFTSIDQFVTWVFDAYHYGTWIDEMMRNIIDEAACFEDNTKAFEFLDRMLPSEISRKLIKRLPFLS